MTVRCHPCLVTNAMPVSAEPLGFFVMPTVEREPWANVTSTLPTETQNLQNDIMLNVIKH
jgi:hypothetical protein